jgi:hypothetical protein
MCWPLYWQEIQADSPPFRKFEALLALPLARWDSTLTISVRMSLLKIM